MTVSPLPVGSRPGWPTGALAVDDLTPAQCQAVTTAAATVCVLAAAGAGKTRVLTRRVAYRVASGTAAADHVLAITFTRKAAGELRERLSMLGLPQPVMAGTFHSLAMGQLRRWWADRRSPEPVLLERKGRLLAELAGARRQLAGVGIADLAGAIEWAKARLVAPDAFSTAVAAARREVPADPDAIAALYGRYEDEKRRRRLVDFDDLLERYGDALESDTAFAAAQRWRWQHVFVDELQDVNPLQCRLLTGLLGDNSDLFVVGDPNQAIYGWNGSDPAFLTDFPQRWPQAEVVRLDDNHRSTPQVVAAATAVLGRQGSELRSSRPDGPLPQLRSYPSDEAEAAGVASGLLSAHGRGLSWAALAVLARTNTQLEVLGQALARAGVPFRAIAAADDDKTAAVLDVAGAPGMPQRSPGGRPSPPSGDHGEELVTLCTFHRAKGLQWPAVWLCGLEAGLVPIAYATTNAALAEERRLLYVAMTRAERYLYCSWARSRRTASGASLWREPSGWLAALSQHCLGGETVGTAGLRGPARGPAGGRYRPGTPAGAPGPGGARGATIEFIASARTRLSHTAGGAPLTAGGPSDEQTAQAVERLREWRRRLARASGVPPYVLLHDSTLLAIAERQPATCEELLTVPGIGPVKVSRFGPGILDVVRGGAPAVPVPAPPPLAAGAVPAGA